LQCNHYYELDKSQVTFFIVQTDGTIQDMFYLVYLNLKKLEQTVIIS